MHKEALIAFGIGKPKKESVLFTAPEGLDLGQVDDGEEVEVVAKVAKVGDKIELVSVNNIPLEAEEEEAEDQEEEMEDEDVDQDLAAEAGRNAMEEDSVSSRARAAGLM